MFNPPKISPPTKMDDRDLTKYGLGASPGAVKGGFTTWNDEGVVPGFQEYALPTPYDTVPGSEADFVEGTLVLCATESGTTTSFLLSVPDFIDISCKQALEYNEERRKSRNITGVKHASTESQKEEEELRRKQLIQSIGKSKLSSENDVLTDMKKCRRVIRVPGVVQQVHAKKTGGRPEYNTYNTKGKVMPLVITGHGLVPNAFRTPFHIQAGFGLYIMFKMVPMSWIENRRTPAGDSVPGQSSYTGKNPRDLVMVPVFYVGRDGGPPPRCTDIAIMKNPEKQPPLLSRSWKSFPNVNDPNECRMEEAMVFKIGTSMFKYAPTIDPADAVDEKVKYMTRREMNLLPRIEAWINPRVIHY